MIESNDRITIECTNSFCFMRWKDRVTLFFRLEIIKGFALKIDNISTLLENKIIQNIEKKRKVKFATFLLYESTTLALNKPLG